MRVRLLLFAALLLSITRSDAVAQPSTLGPATVYVCTAAGQVLAVDGGSGLTSVLYSRPAATFDDCVLGPDGRLYISSGSTVRRVAFGAPATDELVTTLPSAARGLAFNVADLYVATAGSTTVAARVFRVPGVAELSSLPADAVPASPLGGAGRGLVFDVEGNLVVAAGERVHAFPPMYSSSGPAVWSASGSPTAFAPRGVAVDTCGQAIFADRSSKTIKRRTASGAVATISGLPFGSKDIPQYLEIDSANRLYIVTAEDDAGSNAKVWRAVLPFATAGEAACNAAASSLSLLVNLKSSLSGPGKVLGLSSAAALGIAAGPTSYSLTKAFTTSACSQLYHFGYHTVSISFTNCGALPDGGGQGTYELTLTAVKSPPSEVEFIGSFVPAPPGSIEGMRYSPMGGYVVQYLLHPLSGASQAPSPFLAKYSFFTQEFIATPGVARHDSVLPAAVFDESVGTEYWDLRGLGFDPAGERVNTFSKRVVYNTSLKVQGIFGGFEEPLNTGNPLFKIGQTIKIAFKIVDSAGKPVNGGNLRVSLVRIDDPAFPVQTVTSNAQVDNIVAALGGGKYVYNMLTGHLGVGTYMLTIFGDVLPISEPGAQQYTQKIFSITQ